MAILDYPTSAYDINAQEMQYLNMLGNTLRTGQVKTDRTGTGTTSVFGRMMRFNLLEGFPLLTTKKVHLKSIIHELIWFLAGDTNIKYLKDNSVTIWDEWADENGNLGPVYGGQWRRWEDTKMLSMEDDRAQIEKLIAQGYGVVAQFPSSFAYEGNTSAAAMTVVLKKEFDQITDALNLIKHNPDSRRIIVNAWNVGDIPGMKLPPCHAMYQFYVSDLTLDERIKMRDDMVSKEEEEWRNQSKEWYECEMRTYRYGRDYWPKDEQEAHKALDTHTSIPRKKLSCMLYQRSADTFLGVPFNIASYAILTHMFAQQAGMAAGDFIWVGGDVHVYSNHTEQVNLQLSREVRPLPQLVIKRKPESIFDYKFEDFEITGYDPHPAIKAPVAV